jgi:hypothetical protein
MAKVQRHTTITAEDEYGNILTANLKPGDELPDWAPETAANNELLFIPLEGEEPIVDDETGTEVVVSEVTPEDHTSPSVTAGYDSAADATEAARAEEKAAREGGEYGDMTKDQLSALLEERGLPHSGTRQELINRLEQSDAENA